MSCVRNDYHGPDKLDKGARGGACNRSACQQPGAFWFNHSTRRYYCEACADWLNTDRFNRADAMELWGHDLCTLVPVDVGCRYCGAPQAEHEPSDCCGDGGGSIFSRDRNAQRHDREAGHGPKDESANSSRIQSTSPSNDIGVDKP